jgi:hypothetical protein
MAIEDTNHSRDCLIRTNLDYIRSFYQEIIDILSDHGYQPQDEKRFKEDITSFIYTLSEDPK